MFLKSLMRMPKPPSLFSLEVCLKRVNKLDRIIHIVLYILMSQMKFVHLYKIRFDQPNAVCRCYYLSSY